MSDRQVGEWLVVLGAVISVVGLLFLPVFVMGIVLVAVGLLITRTAPPQPRYYYAVPSGSWPTPPIPPGAIAPCPVCAMPMTWVAPYRRWYCTRCQGYR